MKPHFMWLPKYFTHVGVVKINGNIYVQFVVHLKFNTKIVKVGGLEVV